jgi:lipoprotein-anchoring transpeptidase ErfK/SrfK
MSDEIYVGSQPSKKGCLLLLGGIVLACAIVGGILWKWRQSGARSGKAPPTEAAAPPAPAAPAPQTPAASTPDEGPALLAEARKLKNEDKLIECREKAWEALEKTQRPDVRAETVKLLGEVNVTLALSPRNMPEKVEHVVQPGDSLVILARRYGTTADAIRKGNRLSGTVIRVNDRLRILTGKFRIQVSKSRNTLDLYLNDRLFKQYRVGTGEYGKTPEGDFTILEKIAQPTWWKDGKAIPYGHPENVLGTHWMSLNIPGYGIHGTWEPDTIGKQASAGCIRLSNEDIEELFTLVPEGTPVSIGP